MSLTSYSFPNVGTGVMVAVSGEYMRSGIPITPTGLTPDPTVVDTGTGNLDVTWDIASPTGNPSASAFITIYIHNDYQDAIGSVELNWGDSIIEFHSAGYGVAHPLPRLFSHVYTTSSATIIATAKSAVGAPIDSASLTLTGIPLSANYDVDQIKLTQSDLSQNSEICVDWVDVTGAANPTGIFSPYGISFISAEARTVNFNRLPSTGLLPSSQVASATGLTLDIVRQPTIGSPNTIFRPSLVVKTKNVDGLLVPANNQVTLSLFSGGPGVLIGDTSKKLFDGAATFNVAVTDTGNYVIQASSPGFTSDLSSTIRVS